MPPKLQFCQKCPFFHKFTLSNEMHMDCHCDKYINILEPLFEISSFYAVEQKYIINENSFIPNGCPYFLEQTIIEYDNEKEKTIAFALYKKYYEGIP